jgi:hypothetical protein
MAHISRYFWCKVSFMFDLKGSSAVYYRDKMTTMDKSNLVEFVPEYAFDKNANGWKDTLNGDAFKTHRVDGEYDSSRTDLVFPLLKPVEDQCSVDDSIQTAADAMQGLAFVGPESASGCYRCPSRSDWRWPWMRASAAT